MTPRVLIAGVGNVFLGDDGFGVEVAARLSGERLPDGVAAVDFGVRGIHLAYELLEPPELLLVVDAVSRGGEPGLLYLIEPNLSELSEQGGLDAHGMDLPSVFSRVRALGGALPRVLIVGCEPALLDEHLGLSEPIRAAVEPALELVRETVRRELGARDPAKKEVEES